MTRKVAIEILKNYNKGFTGYAGNFQEAIDFAINSLEVDEAYQLEYEHIPYITLDELKELREVAWKHHSHFDDDKDLEVDRAINDIVGYIDKKISELEKRE